MSKLTIPEAIQIVCTAFQMWECEYCYIDDWEREHQARDLAVEALEKLGGDYRKYIDALRKCAKEHEKDFTGTGCIKVSDLCNDTADLLESLEEKER